MERVPSLHTQPLFANGALRLSRVRCDGRDAPRPEPELSADDRAIIALSGRFSIRGERRRAVVHPGRALVVRAGEEFTFHHPSGEGDVCLAVRGAAVAALANAGVEMVCLGTREYTRLQRLGAALQAGRAVDALAVEGALCEALSPAPPVGDASARARAAAERIAYELALRFDEPVSLEWLASKAGASVFAACRMFRQATGWSIHQYQQELRLRHALALLLDTSLPLARIAVEAGFANQGHFGNRFRRRFGITPRQARTDEGYGMLSEAPSLPLPPVG